jgi:hypothetical protein
MMPSGFNHAVPLAACTPVYGYPDVLTHPVYPVGPIQAPAAAADPIQQVQPAQDQQEARREDLPGQQEPGHEVEFSVTIQCKGRHVVPGWLDLYLNFLKARCVAGFGGLERGKKAENLHIQAMMRMIVTGPVNKKLIDLIRNQIKAAIGVKRADGSDCQVYVSAFAPGQSWTAMLGYCSKDMGKPHHADVRFNVTDEEINAGKAAWAAARISYEDDRLVLTKKSLFQALYASMYRL